MYVAVEMGNLTKETAGAEAEAAKNIEVTLSMEGEEAGGDAIEGKEGGDGTLKALGALDFLTQDAKMSGTTLFDARNGFNKLSLLAML